MADGRNLALRVASALVLAPLAILVAYLGGWPFIMFWGAASAGILWEWTRLVDPRRFRTAFLVGACALAVAAVSLGLGQNGVALLAVAAGGIVAAIVADHGMRLWMSGGVVYAGALVLAATLLRADAQYGFFVVILLCAIVWGTDILGYFVGRAVGGPKLAPLISPKKTWSGAIAGAGFALIAAVAISMIAGQGNAVFIGCVAVCLSVVSQVGDLFESKVKRLFDAKDSSGLIPGHGGLMDRLDGFVAAAAAAALIGALRAGLDAPARGLIGW